MYNSVNGSNSQANLSPEDQEILESLTSPDNSFTFKFDESLNRKILARLFQNSDFYKNNSNLIKPEYFPSKPQATLYRIFKDYFKKYNSVPDTPIIKQEIINLRGSFDAEATLIMAEYVHIRDYFKESFPAQDEYLQNAITEFIKQQTFNVGVRDILDKNIRPGKIGWENKLIELSNSLKSIGNFNSDDAEGISFDELELLANESFSWLVENLIPAGTLNMLVGRGKGGKTTFLYHQLIEMIYNHKFAGEDTTEVPIIWLDYENPLYHPAHIQKAALIGKDKTKWNEFFRFRSRLSNHKNVSLPSYANIGFVQNLCSLAEKRLGKPGLFVIDPLMEAFHSSPDLPEKWSYDPNAAIDILRPFREFCHNSGWTGLLIHHTTGDTTKAFGSAFFKNSIDIMHVFERNEGCTTAKLSFEGRIPAATSPKGFEFENGICKYIGSTTNIKKEKLEQEKIELHTTQEIELKSVITFGQENAQTYTQLGTALNWSKTKVVEVLKRLLADPNLGIHLEESKGKKPSKIWRS